MAGLYIHIPFCAHACPYCDFSFELLGSGQTEAFIHALSVEISRQARQSPWSSLSFHSIFCGGGTPTSLTPEKTRRVFALFRDAFTIHPDAEITVEANPETLTDAKLDMLREAGVNRLSIGVQALSDQTLSRLGRHHSVERAVRAVEQARRVAFRSVSIDLIFAAPGQTIEDWNATLNQALDLNPDHISVYGLTIEEKTPFGALYREGRLTIPDEETQRIMYDLAIDRLAEAGYRHYEVSNWARPGFECLHNLVYWTGADYLGLGPSAHSYCDGKRRANVRTLREYLTRIESGLSGVDFEETLTADQKVQEYILLRLRLMEGFDLEAFQTLFGQRACDTRRGALSRLIRSGFIEQTGTQVRLTRQGLCVADAVCAQLA